MYMYNKILNQFHGFLENFLHTQEEYKYKLKSDFCAFFQKVYIFAKCCNLKIINNIALILSNV